MKSLRILLINKYASVTGGADKHCLDLASLLEAGGHRVSLLASGPTAYSGIQCVVIPSNVTHVQRDELALPQAAKVAMSSLWNPSAAAATKALISTFKPDLVHVHKLYPQLSVAPVAVASVGNTPVVQTVHDYEFVSASPVDHTARSRDHAESRGSYRVLNSTLFQVKRRVHVPRVSKWIAVSRRVRDIYAANGIAATVLPNFTELPADIPAFAQRDGVLYVGRLAPEKGVADVVCSAEASPRIAHTIVGDGPERPSIEAAAARLANLTFLGPLDKSAVDSRIAGARLLLMPSLWQEPGPLTALEGLAHGTPVIAYPNGGLAEYVEDSRGGLVVPQCSEDLAKAVGTLYADRRQWDAASAHAREAAERVHSPDRYVKAIEAIYREAIHDHRPRRLQR